MLRARITDFVTINAKLLLTQRATVVSLISYLSRTSSKVYLAVDVHIISTHILIVKPRILIIQLHLDCVVTFPQTNSHPANTEWLPANED